MQEVFEYKGYWTKIRYSIPDGKWMGKIEGISDFVNFYGKDSDDIEKEFREAVEDYLEFCERVGKQPEKPNMEEMKNAR